MEIVKKLENENVGLYQVGDIFEIKTTMKGEIRFFILARENGKYIFRDLGSKSWQGLSGEHNTIEELINSTFSEILRHYSSDDYCLQLIASDCEGRE